MPDRDQIAGMLCPIDGAALVMSERQGIEIDYCPSCRGVWLDRGELDKIIARSAAETAPMPQPSQPPAAGYEPYPTARGYGDDRDHRRGGYQKRKKSFLSELFD